MYFYTPNVTDRRGELIGAGIASAGNALGNAISQWGQERETDRRDAKAADAMYAALEPKPGADGSNAAHPLMPKDKWDSLSWADKTATMGGYVKSTVMKNAIDEMQQRQQRQQDQAEAQGALPAFLQNFQQNMQPQPGNPDSVVPGSLMTSLAGGQVPPTPAPVPGLPPLAAALRAASQRPEVLNTDIGRNVLEQAIKQGMVTPTAKQVVFGKSPSGTGYAQLENTFTWDPKDTTDAKNAARLAEIEAENKAKSERDQKAAEARAKLTPKQLIDSYQADLKSLDNPMNWSESTPEDRAAHRAELNAKITALREPGAAPVTVPKKVEVQPTNRYTHDWGLTGGTIRDTQAAVAATPATAPAANTITAGKYKVSWQ